MKEIEIDGVTHEFPEDFTDEDIAAALGDSAITDTLGRGAPAEATRTGTPPAGFSQPMSEWLLDAAQASFPLLGTLMLTKGLGSLPGMVLRGGLGMGGGEAAKLGMAQMRGQPIASDPMDAATRIGTAAVEGMGSTALGGALGTMIPTTQAGAREAYRRALNPPASVVQSFPGVVERGLQRKVPVSPAGRAQALKETRGAAQFARNVRSEAQGAGVTFTPRQLSHAALKAAREAKGAPLTAEEIKRVERGVKALGNEYLRTASAGALRPPGKAKPSGLVDQYGAPVKGPREPNQKWTVANVNAIRRAAGKEANPAYRGAERGVITAGHVGPSTMEAGARGALSTIPGHDIAQRELQGAMGLNRAMIAAMNRPQSAWPMTFRTQRFPWSPQMRPDLASRLAIWGYHLPPYIQEGLRHMILRGPQVGMGGIQALLDQPALPDTIPAPPDTLEER